MSLMTDVFEESFFGRDKLRGRKQISRRKLKPYDPEKTMQRMNRIGSGAFMVARDGSLMARPNPLVDNSYAESYAPGTVEDSPFAEYGENIDFSNDVIADAYDNSFNNPLTYNGQEPEPQADNLFGIFESAATRARKLTKRAEKAAAKGKTKKATRLANKAGKFNDKIEAANQAVALNQQKEALRLQSQANNDATRDALNEIREVGGTGGTASDLAMQIQQSMATAAGQISPLASAAYPSGGAGFNPNDPISNSGAGAALSSGGGGGGGIDEPSGVMAEEKTLGGVTVTSSLGGNKTLLIVGGVIALVVVIFLVMKFAKRK